MGRIRETLRFVLASLSVICLIGGALWYPYKWGAVPEWKIQIVDADGHPVVGFRANQEWLDPIDDGITRIDTRQTDTQGFLMFPRRPLHNRLALGYPPYKPTAHIYGCGQGQYGQAFWDAKDREMVTRLELRKGACPFG